jgi:hypothetical protein
MDEASGGLPAAGATAGVIVVRQSRAQRDGLFGALLAVFLVALVRGYGGAQTSTGRVMVVVFVSVVAAALVLGWARLVLRPSRLEISRQEITLVDARGGRRVLSRQSGDQLRVVGVGGGRYRQPALTIQGSGTAIPLTLFSAREVRRQCLAAGWSLQSSRR